MIKKIFSFLIVIPILVSCSGNKPKVVSLKPIQKPVRDGEILRYLLMENDKISGRLTIVNKVDEKEKIITAYTVYIKENSKYKMPDHFTNYPTVIKISKEGSILSFHQDYLTNRVLDQIKDTLYVDLKIDQNSGSAVYIDKTWDGNMLKTVTSRLNIKKDLPVWTWDSTLSLCIRYLDLSGGGFMSMIVPKYVKTSFTGTFIKKNRETIETKAGTFRTIRYTWSMGDAFLSRLMNVYSKNYSFWVDEETGILVKETGSENSSAVLESAGLWNNLKN